MTQNTQTTRERIAVLIHWEGIVEAPNIIAAEIDALTAERDEARAEVERLRPAAEAWEAQEVYRRACVAWDAGRLKPVEFAEEQVKFNAAAARARARAAKVTP